MAEHHYKSNLRDIEFNLFEFLKIQESTLGHGEFTTMDEATARDTLQGVLRMAENELAASFVEGDRVPLQFDGEGNVKLPQGIKDSLKAWFDAEWHRLEVPERLGGFGAPPTITWAGWEMVSGANASAAFYQFGTFIARVIDNLATDEQKAMYVQNIIDNHWGATMVLTEPDAGSDVGAGRSKARQIEGNLYEIEGTKRFITNGDFDGTDNIVHLVLARPEGAKPGTKGLSMFIVPKYWVNEDGSLGERNGVYVTGVEDKMGLKASATCELTMGDGKPCKGLLVGGVHDGIRQMFMVIEQARMSIGFKSMSTLSTAYFNALEYAKERVQGPDLAKAMDKTAPRVAIIQHPDVRRMLMTMKSYAEGMRGLALYAAQLQDKVEILGGHKAEGTEELSRRSDLLLPLMKGGYSEKVYELLGTALQVFGGSGFVKDYPMEQYIRDQKIDSLYEGTTAIQALDFFFRKVAKDGGATLTALLMDVKKVVDDEAGGDMLGDERLALSKALGNLEGIFGLMMQKVGESVYHAGLVGNRVLFAVTDTLLAWKLIEHAALAAEKLEGANEADKAYYQGKIASARFFCREFLPSVAMTKKIVEGSTLDIMELPVESF
jgi:alkylation response protein AidB-like acyl-CoA dehydrogenase